jgi:hemoglobin
MAEADARMAATPYELVGGAATVRDVVDRFYDLMEQEPYFAELRALHAPDLAPMRESLTGFLIAWLGGPRDWFVRNPGKCVMSLHGKVAIDALTAGQWAEAMRRAIAGSSIESGLGAKMADALEGMAQGMVRD